MLGTYSFVIGIYKYNRIMFCEFFLIVDCSLVSIVTILCAALRPF